MESSRLRQTLIVFSMESIWLNIHKQTEQNLHWIIGEMCTYLFTRQKKKLTCSCNFIASKSLKTWPLDPAKLGIFYHNNLIKGLRNSRGVALWISNLSFLWHWVITVLLLTHAKWDADIYKTLEHCWQGRVVHIMYLFMQVHFGRGWSAGLPRGLRLTMSSISSSLLYLA